MRLFALAAALAGLAASSLPAAAEIGAGDPVRGKQLSVRWCSTCHVVAPGQPGGDAGPPFERIAPNGLRTEGELEAWLFDPHAPMPQMDLSPAEIADIIAHIKELGQ